MKLKYFIKFRKLALGAAALASALQVTACSRKVESGTLGLNLSSSQSTLQTCARSQVCTPLLVRLSAMSDSLPLAEFPVTFGFCNGVSTSGFQLVSTSSQTDADGYARLVVRASARSGDSECLSARIAGRSQEVRFTINVTDNLGSKHLVVNLTQGTPNPGGGLYLGAGIPFGFRFSIVDDNGDVATSTNETMDLLFSNLSTSIASGTSTLGLKSSWLGQAPIVPTQISCVFVSGICNSPLTSYTLTDVLTKATLTVTPVSVGSAYGPGSLAVTLTAGTAARLAFADAIGGPIAAAHPILSTQVAGADDVVPHDYVLSYTDSVGNFIRDLGTPNLTGLSVTTDGIVMVNGSNLNAQAPAGSIPLRYRFAPAKAGLGTLNVTQTGITTGAALQVTVSPGVLARFSLDISAIPLSGSNPQVTAGVSTSVRARAEDQKGNLCTGFNCNSSQCSLGVQALNGSSIPAVSGGPNGAGIFGGSMSSIDTASSTTYPNIGGLSFTSGLSDSFVTLKLNDASKTPQIAVQGIYTGTTLTASATGTFKVVVGAFHHLNLYDASNLRCAQPFTSCVTTPAVHSRASYTLKPEDAGGNIVTPVLPLVIGQVSSLTSTYSEWAWGGGGFPAIDFNPLKSGNSSLTIVYAGLSTTFGVQNTQAGLPTSFNLRSTLAIGTCTSGAGSCYRAFEADCIPIQITLYDVDSNATRVTAGTVTLSSLSNTPDVAGANTGGLFYPGNTCTAGSDLTSISFNSSSPSYQFYFKPNVRTDGLSPTFYTIKASGLSQIGSPLDRKLRISN